MVLNHQTQGSRRLILSTIDGLIALMNTTTKTPSFRVALSANGRTSRTPIESPSSGSFWTVWLEYFDTILAQLIVYVDHQHPDYVCLTDNLKTGMTSIPSLIRGKILLTRTRWPWTKRKTRVQKSHFTYHLLHENQCDRDRDDGLS